MPIGMPYGWEESTEHDKIACLARMRYMTAVSAREAWPPGGRWCYVVITARTGTLYAQYCKYVGVSVRGSRVR